MSEWNSGLFDCCNDCGICFYGWCCAPCLFGENAEKIDGSSCFGQCCVWYLLAGFGLCCLVHMGKREALRRRFGLQEDCNDCLATTFCATCAICQEARELKFRGAALATTTPVVVQPGQGNMYPALQPVGASMYPPNQPMYAPPGQQPMYAPQGQPMYPPLGQPIYAPPGPPAYAAPPNYDMK